MPKGIGYPSKRKTHTKVFKKSEKQKIKKHYQTKGADPGNPVKYKDTAEGKAAYKRARKGKTSTAKKKY